MLTTFAFENYLSLRLGSTVVSNRPNRGLKRRDTAELLSRGFPLAFFISVAVLVWNWPRMNLALNMGSHRATLYVGMSLILLSGLRHAILMGQLRDPTDLILNHHLAVLSRISHTEHTMRPVCVRLRRGPTLDSLNIARSPVTAFGSQTPNRPF
jgi:hypothetical protein